jgi:hypothetical protein
MQFDQLKRREFITPLTGADFELGAAKADFLAIEQRWLSLARSYEVETVSAAPRRAPRSQRK